MRNQNNLNAHSVIYTNYQNFNANNYIFLILNGMKNKQTKILIPVGTKSYPLIITDTWQKIDNTPIVQVFCEIANLKQEYPKEDLPLLLEDIPGLIRDEISTRADSRVSFRVSSFDKLKIDENAKKYGYKNTSEFLKAVGTHPELAIR